MVNTVSARKRSRLGRARLLWQLLVPMQVTHAFDGEEAYSTILERGGPDAFDVILMDLHMPRKVSAARSAKRHNVSAAVPSPFLRIRMTDQVPCAACRRACGVGRSQWGIKQLSGPLVS